jgi:hypothetical protein
MTEELGPEDVNYFQSLIGILRWTVELGRIDMIITEVSKLASHMALPRQGHFLEAAFHVFAYLEQHPNYLLALDPTYPEIDDGKFNAGADWKEMYPGAEEMIPPNMPEPRGLKLVLRLFVDLDHAGDKLIRRSRSGYIIYANCAPILGMSKRQGTIESSVFGAEFVAMKKVGLEVHIFVMVINNETKRDPVADKQQIKSKGQMQRGVSAASRCARAQGKLRRRRI